MNEPTILNVTGQPLFDIVKARDHVNLIPYESSEEGGQPSHPDDAKLLEARDAATIWCERYMFRTLVAKQYQLVLDSFGCFNALIRLPMAAPLVSVDSVSYINADGEDAVLAPTDYKALLHMLPGRILRRSGQPWPTVSPDGGAVSIVYSAGYADGKVPSDILRAVKQVMAEFFENREDTTPLNQRPVSFSAQTIMQGYRLYDENAA